MLCQSCKIEFQPVRYDAKYCSPRCRTAAHRKAKERYSPPYWGGKRVRWRERKLGIAQRAAEIVDSYDMPVTVRQIYYQLVSANVIPNNQDSYDMVVTLLLEARQNGLIDWDKIEDRGRRIVKPVFWSSPTEFKASLRNMYDEDRWQIQDQRVAVIIEKNALSGLIEPICDRWQVPFIAAGGYLSMTVLKDAAQIFDGYTILYAGDHDGSGQDMPRHIAQSLASFGCFAPVLPIALTLDQVEQYDLAPNMLKETDSRSDEYFERHGIRSVWELDALPPDVLQSIVEKAITDRIDMDKWRLMEQQVNERRAKL
jgi:hypothetical protein